MAGSSHAKPRDFSSVGKSPTGIPGLDEITHGGLPRAGRPCCAARPAAARRCSA